MTLDWVGPMVLSKDEVQRIPDRIGGVYLLHAWALAYGGYPIYYVGSTQDLRRRLLEHLQSTAKPILRAMHHVESTYWSATPIVDSDLRAGVEAGLIALLSPPCNQQKPRISLIPVNLPPLHTY